MPRSEEAETKSRSSPAEEFPFVFRLSLSLFACSELWYEFVKAGSSEWMSNPQRWRFCAGELRW
jgi:hypothetical protein